MTIVLVDDDARYRRIARRTLEDEGAVVTAEAEDGCEALRILRGCPADVALVDIGLPALSGTEVARRLRADGTALVVILISTRDPEYGRRAAEGIAAGFIAKDVLSLAAIRGLVATAA